MTVFYLLRTFSSLIFVIIMIGVLSASSIHSETPEQKGYKIAEEASQRDEGFGHYMAKQIMTLKNRQGQESSREMTVKVLEGKNEGDKSLIIFNSPKDVKGTALLTHAHLTKDDEQWLYLPALKRVKRISSSNKAGSFMGSEFTYEDMVSRELDKYSYRFINEESCNDKHCVVLESTPKDKKSGYKRQVAWIDTEHFRTWKVQYFDLKDSHFKTLITNEYKQFNGKYWRPKNMFMENHLTGKSTLLTWHKYDFDTTMRKNEFTKVGLKRAR